MAGNISDERIPNNVDLGSDRRLQRALCDWQPNFVDWWKDMGPEGFQTSDVYLRTAVSVDAGGWAHFDYVKHARLPLGHLPRAARSAAHHRLRRPPGRGGLAEVPGEYRNMLRRLIVTQADTEPASVEQQRLLGKTAPSLYDLRNLFQVNVEEGRHLWAMVYLLHSYFGRDGREEAEELLERRSRRRGPPAHPAGRSTSRSPTGCTSSASRCSPTATASISSGRSPRARFDPLARTTRFMLTEEAHHLFVGETGVDRVIQRTAS
jgi:benzoyl-CoA 2,3-dioxygenase component B